MAVVGNLQGQTAPGAGASLRAVKCRIGASSRALQKLQLLHGFPDPLPGLLHPVLGLEDLRLDHPIYKEIVAEGVKKRVKLSKRS